MAAFDSFLGEIHGLEKFGRILGKLTILQVKLTGLSWFIMVYHGLSWFIIILRKIQRRIIIFPHDS